MIEKPKLELVDSPPDSVFDDIEACEKPRRSRSRAVSCRST